MLISLLLEIKNLTTKFTLKASSHLVVKDISFNLHKGETIGIVGESGSGKSITALSAMKLSDSLPNSSSSGEILFHQKSKTVDFNLLSEKQMQSFRGNEIAMVFQEPMTALNPVMKCGKQVVESILIHQKELTDQSKSELFFEKIKLFFLNIISPVLYALSLGKIPFFNVQHTSKKEKAAKAKTIQLFKKVKLSRPYDIFNSYPHEISGGQKQRVIIAMALSCNPSILIADEPTTSLDVTVQKAIITLLKDLQKELQMGILFISHDLTLVAELADKVLVMYNGKIVEKGNVNQVYKNPKHPYTIGLLACKPPININLKELPTRKHFTEIDEHGFSGDVIKSIDDVLKELTIKKSDIEFRNTILYQQEPLIEVKNLLKKYPLKSSASKMFNAVNNVSFKIYPGETLGLVGESGCGKSTLGKLLLNLINPSSGSVYFNSTDISNFSNKQMRPLRKDMQIIFQDPYSSLNPNTPIGKAIMEPMKVHKICENDFQRKQEALQLLAKVGIEKNSFNKYPHEFSGGQRQRICIARALALRPKFIVCDESVSALDVSVQAEVLNLLNTLRDQFGLTYLFISHDLSVVKYMSDRILVMNKGKIVEKGLADEIYFNPQKKHTKTLINSIPKGLVD
ncbi:MAG: ABC transporter ATP-binding protein [Flavobacteriales bacterium]|nr:ABC transporter ATP-binding protein [Flavobacteriales bacterium]